jgi:hypothetical protein
MTAAFQTGQFHPNEGPANNLSIFKAMAAPPDSGVNAETVATARMAQAAQGLGVWD